MNKTSNLVMVSTDTDRKFSMKRAWLVVGLLSVVGCLNYLDRGMITTMRGSIIADMPMTDAQYGLLTSVFLWVYGLLSPFAGFLADRFNKSKVIIISLFVWSLVTWLTAHATTYNHLLITRALMGISEACYIPAAFALIVDYHRGGTRSLATGLHTAGIMIGQSLGFVGGWIAEKSHWNNAFYIFGIVGIVYSFILLFLLKDRPDHKNVTEGKVLLERKKVNFIAALKHLTTNKSFLLLLLFWAMLGIIGWMIMGWLPTYYQEEFHLSQTQAGIYATGYLYPVALVGGLFGGYLADRARKRFVRGRILVPAIGLLIAVPGVFIAGSTLTLVIAIGGFMLYGFTRIFSDVNLMPMLCMISDKRYRATGYGLLNMFSCIVGGIGIYASGALRDDHINMGFLFKIAAGIMLVCALILFSIHPKKEFIEEETI